MKLNRKHLSAWIALLSGVWLPVVGIGTGVVTVKVAYDRRAGAGRKLGTPPDARVLSATDLPGAAILPSTERRRLIPSADIQTSSEKLSAVKLGTVQDIKEAAGLCGVDPSLYTRLVARESNFDPNAISWAGAVGLAQVKPSTARELSQTLDVVNRPFDNLLAGACLLRQHYDRTGSWREALHDYNAGRWRKVTTQATRDYAEQILTVPKETTREAQ